MTPEVLTQRHGLSVRTYTLSDDAVEVTQRSLLRRSVWRIPYVELANERFESTTYSRIWLWLTVISVSLCVVIVVAEVVGGDTEGLSAVALYGVFAVLFGALFWQSREPIVGFHAVNVPLWLGARNPSAASVEDFIANMEKRKLNFLRQNYLIQASGGSIADELQKLLWLRDQGAISAEEYESLKRATLGGDREDRPPPSSLH